MLVRRRRRAQDASSSGGFGSATTGATAGSNASSSSSSSSSATGSTASTCASDPLSVLTDYNGDPNVVPLVGYMFGMDVHERAVDVLTFEVQVRLDLLGGNYSVPSIYFTDNFTAVAVGGGSNSNSNSSSLDAPDLLMEVFYMEGDYKDYASNASAWTPVARAVAVPAPLDRGVIVPAQHFAPTALLPNTRYSWYVTMGSLKALLDNTVNALDQAGETAQQGGDFDILVGSALTDITAIFPKAGINRFVDPQFAGVIYYDVQESCAALDGSALVSTQVEYQFLPSAAVATTSFSPLVDAALQTEFLSGTPAAIGSSNGADATSLIAYVSQYGLKLQSGATTTTPVTYSGGCPVTWKACQTSYLSTVVTYVHQASLSSDQLMLAAYNVTTLLTQAVQDQLPTVLVYYLGLTSIRADYIIQLYDVASPQVDMDAVQQQYFGQTTQDFIQSTTGLVDVFNMTVDGQKWSGPQQHRRRGRRQLASSGGSSSSSAAALEVSGTLWGAKLAYLDDASAANAIGSLFTDNGHLYTQLLSTNLYLPGPINAGNRGAYFARVSADPTTVFTIVDSPETRGETVSSSGSSGAVTGADSGSGTPSSNKTLILAICGAIVGVLVAGAVGLFLYLVYQKRTKKQKLEQGGAAAKGGRSPPNGSSAPTPGPAAAAAAAAAAASTNGGPYNLNRTNSNGALHGDNRRRPPQRSKSSDDMNSCEFMAPDDIKKLRLPEKYSSGRQPQPPPPPPPPSKAAPSLSSFMDRQMPSQYRPTDARTVGPGVVPPRRTKSSDNQWGSLQNDRQQPRTQPAASAAAAGSPPSSNGSSRSVGREEPSARGVQRTRSADSGVPPPQRGPVRSASSDLAALSQQARRGGRRPGGPVSPQPPPKGKLSGYLDSNSNQQQKAMSNLNASKSVGGAPSSRAPPQRAHSQDGYPMMGGGVGGRDRAPPPQQPRPPTRRDDPQYSGKPSPSLSGYLGSQLPPPSANQRSGAKSVGPGVAPPARRPPQGDVQPTNVQRSYDDSYLPKRPSMVRKPQR